MFDGEGTPPDCSESRFLLIHPSAPRVVIDLSGPRPTPSKGRALCEMIVKDDCKVNA